MAGTGGHHQEHRYGQRDDATRLQAELERARREHALAMAAERHGRKLAEAEAGHLRAQLSARAEQLVAQAGHIADLQQALRAKTPVRTELPSLPGQTQSGRQAIWTRSTRRRSAGSGAGGGGVF
ncbi:hypothetical protein [Streptomyces sp. or20]|uniref:hypothetical protein n=1 Tax=Streptomyces sp. or20 TaxID=1828016 RepID=UPI000BF15E8E|nr:hypothetical protein [Streptomyces sp. or20]